jgi:hypothetical protein
MPRFTSVQTYADNNANLRKLTYEQATGGGTAASGDGDNKAASAVPAGSVKTEKVVNPYGSAAGAGSGEFHVYRHARAREMARWKELDKAQQEEMLEKEFLETQAHEQQEIDAATEKRRRKRQREKESKKRKKHLKAAGIEGGKDTQKEQQDEDEFTYVPESKQHTADEETKTNTDGENSKVEGSALPVMKLEDAMVPACEEVVIENDGSFLEMMKKRLQQEQLEQEKELDEEGPMLPPTGAATDASAKEAFKPKPKRIVETKIIDEEF